MACNINSLDYGLFFSTQLLPEYEEYISFKFLVIAKIDNKISIFFDLIQIKALHNKTPETPPVGIQAAEEGDGNAYTFHTLGPFAW